MANKEWTDHIAAGQSVAKFLDQINDNFSILKEKDDTKQSKIYVMSMGSSENDVSVNQYGVPQGGSNGDIMIVYETQ